MMLAMAATAGRKGGVRILPDREHRRGQRKREGGEQQDGEQAAHGSSDKSSVRLRSKGLLRMFSAQRLDRVKFGTVVV
jgi:hypothetical protein